jgi:hypothetical protein
MTAVSLVDTLIWTTLASATGLAILILKDEGFFIRKPTARKPAARRAMAA